VAKAINPASQQEEETSMPATIGDVITPGQDNAFTVKNRQAGALKDLAPTYRQLLTDPVTASLTTINGKGEMQVTPVWVGNDGTHIELNSARGRLKDRNLRGNGKVTLLFLNPKNPYHWMSINGKVVDVIDEDDKSRGHLATQSIDALAKRYVNQTPYPFRDKGEVRVLYKVEPTEILTFGNP
jgi:PPOX class probable F420-dependent enzyme